ncbi:hypothetical protein CW736_11420 [Nonlabens sp. MB-3u-79]|uniref:DUF5677 domain-containing protein n=1 Tax=Nonlabens sp. MB-3u-79 TaxID=2058134 RepID=UPI000C30FDC0|nr:DUF5677 domain-containing protein [Nonlabens sp. MB-3u-79]AUC79933.1 hypothetical protein CW736_11420 [Nonlabens sp. MB-3u-79]
MNNEEKIKTLINEASSLNLSSLIPSLEKVLQENAFVVQSFYDAKPKLGIGELYQETLLIKIIFTSRSILELSKGIEFGILNRKERPLIIDRTSLYILTRSVIESFLTLEYLYFNNLSREEQIFRYNLWRISGFMARQDFVKTKNEEFLSKIEREKVEIQELKKTIKTSPYYSKLKKQQLWKLDNYGLPRIMSWSALLNQSILKTDIFEKVYKLYSNYAHSEFIAMIQLNEGKMSKSDSFNTETTVTTLNNIRVINCVSIISFINKYKFSKDKYMEIDESSRYVIEFWNKFGIEE